MGQTTELTHRVALRVGYPALRSFFRFCVDSGWTDKNPVLGIKPPQVEPNPTLPFSSEEVQKILSACEPLSSTFFAGGNLGLTAAKDRNLRIGRSRERTTSRG